MTETHHSFMQQALDLAARAQFSAAPNPMVGCVIVRDGQIIGSGWHVRPGEPHAEVHALREAGAAAAGATLYVTLEPCSHFGRTPPCVDAVIDAQVGRVVIAMQDPNPLVGGKGISRLLEAGIAVEVGILEAQAELLNRGFLSRIRRRRPWLRVKLAATLDGRTALANGVSQWITGPAARHDVHRWRACSGAILSTARTVLADNARLTARHELAERQPLRVIIDTQRQLAPTQAFFHETSPVLLVYAGPEPEHDDEQSWPEHVERCWLPALNGKVDLNALMQELAVREVNEVWTECGAELAGALLSAGLVDELIIYMAPKLFGDTGRSLLQLPAFQQVQQVPELVIKDLRLVGEDIRVTAIPQAVRGETQS
ncbi:bifunctional diaminohydroxyphosphoribosylaminopyrimidine deaminase/5-amino-6-(5-phosphoribosylamino)uracil reductase RibD [Pseudidiomarina sp.]|uniref:bifunctional diaminohydroxyphosphoribosylaminopyrimidine deaminase/5-amino-6-(5-phosphoribosylamino)uracil reductase RibD n=1 Tax=Pseudidiomarina sp. TaxID=2081707 RepID=UPI00299F247D|nr:bifunctional diaminohydroxyphosphoribosylaminopyrimidine deaminase/5-amino-6-(5-phosphoribosylamino)uracil reductase RibD [Pseudidiomarina sp.]MDX1705118.1 bifunctional diaminohydroxyphosphoribosylaminopyrimidine deaminase/5-amino-6-(5-phosphoribosylamino)uracil reductase RibD [Pseudidiomarina sp.]